MLGYEIGMRSQPIAGTLDLDDHGMVEQAIEQRGGDDGIAEDLAPLGKTPVGCQDHGTFFVTRIDELEEQIGAAGRDRQITDLIDDQQARSNQEADLVGQATLSLGPVEGLDQLGERTAINTAPGLDGRHAERRRQMALAGSGRTNLILLDIMAVRRSFTTPFTRAAARRWPLCAATGSGRAGCWSSFSSTGRWRRYPPGCVSRMRHRCLSGIGLGSA